MIKLSLILDTDSQGGVRARVDNESLQISETEIEVLRLELRNGFGGYEEMLKIAAESMANGTQGSTAR